MGQRQSRQSYNSTSSEAALKGIWSPRAPQTSEPPRPVSNITHPDQPREITRLSALIDPEEFRFDWTIRSPSGNLLGPTGFFNHPARPLSMRERQERVRAAVIGSSSSRLSDTTTGMGRASTTSLQATRAMRNIEATNAMSDVQAGGTATDIQITGTTNKVSTARPSNMQAGDSNNAQKGDMVVKIETSQTNNISSAGTRTKLDTGGANNTHSSSTTIIMETDTSSNVKVDGADKIQTATGNNEIEKAGTSNDTTINAANIEAVGTTTLEKESKTEKKASNMANKETGYTSKTQTGGINKQETAGDTTDAADEEKVRAGNTKKLLWLFCCFGGGVE